jgi:hypothetical protein
MRADTAALVAMLIVLLLQTTAHAGAPAGCRHALTPVPSADAIPPAVTAPLKFIAFHGEPWNATDSVTPGARTASFQWAAHFGPDWIVAYSVGGISCCFTRFMLLLPQGKFYVPVIPVYPQKVDWFADASCARIDAALTAFAGAR